MIEGRLGELAGRVLQGEGIKREEALWLMGLPLEIKINESILEVSSEVRQRFFSNAVELCSIVNAKSGMCTEDCAFCSQSRVSRARIERYRLLPADRLVEAARAAKGARAHRFSIVTSGRRIAPRELERVCEAVKQIRREVGIEVDVSIGALDRKGAELLREAGIGYCHHNLETSPGFFGRICTTHPFEERLETIRTLQDVGLEVCSGGIFGLGEGDEDRVELALLLRDLGVRSIPLNFLRPIAGTPLEHAMPLDPWVALRIIAMFRLVNPRAVIRVCGGREFVLGDLQGLIFRAGANGIMVGNYLTTSGSPPEEDHRMIALSGMRLT